MGLIKVNTNNMRIDRSSLFIHPTPDFNDFDRSELVACYEKLFNSLKLAIKCLKRGILCIHVYPN